MGVVTGVVTGVVPPPISHSLLLMELPIFGRQKVTSEHIVFVSMSTFSPVVHVYHDLAWILEDDAIVKHSHSRMHRREEVSM